MNFTHFLVKLKPLSGSKVSVSLAHVQLMANIQNYELSGILFCEFVYVVDDISNSATRGAHHVSSQQGKVARIKLSMTISRSDIENPCAIDELLEDVDGLSFRIMGNTTQGSGNFGHARVVAGRHGDLTNAFGSDC